MPETRILIVEDELIVALELEDRLRRQGYAVVGTARSAVEALTLCSEARPDLALLDIRIAGDRDGVELARDLQTRDVPVVFLTAHGDDETLGRVKSVDAQGYLLKPFDERLLHLTIETALHRHAAERARLEAERGRRAAETLQASILEHSPDGVLVVAKDGTIELANHAAQVMFGLSPGASTRLRDLMCGLDHAAFLPASCDRAVRRVEALRRGGERFPAEIASGIAPLDDHSRLILIVRDVSVQSELEQRLARARQLEIAGRIASGVAHDLNNLLSVVWMSTYMIHKAPPSELPGLLEELENAVHLGAALTTRLLSMVRRNGGEARAVPVNPALETIARLVRRTIGSAVHIASELDPRAGTVYIDPTELDQLVLNLALNADRAMPEGGLLTIRSAAVAVAGSPTLVAIEVEDTGVGIDEAIQAQVFDPFFSTRSGAGGTGLGLSIVKDIVDDAGGGLEFESALGRGTRFRVTLPRCGDAEGESEWAPLDHSTIAGDGRTVLLVDDDELHRRTLARLFEAQGFRPLHARGAGEAILIAERGHERLALAVVDFEMPYMDGIELSARLKQIQADLPVLLISGSANVLDTDRLVANAAMRKPLKPESLFHEVARMLDSSPDNEARRRS